jgi:hypothetical protein
MVIMSAKLVFILKMKGFQNMTKFEFTTPYVLKALFEEDEDEPEDTEHNTYDTFVFDIPAAVLPYARSENTTIEPGYIGWRIGGELEKLLRNWVIPALDLSLTPKGNFRKPDQEHVDRCLTRLEARIRNDLSLWLENDPRYQSLIRDRVNEAIRDLLKTEVKTAA